MSQNLKSSISYAVNSSFDYGSSKMKFRYSLKWKVYSSIKLSILYQGIDEHLTEKKVLESVYGIFKDLKTLIITEGHLSRKFSNNIIVFMNDNLRIFLAKWDKKKLELGTKEPNKEFERDLAWIQQQSKDYINKMYRRNIWLKKHL